MCALLLAQDEVVDSNIGCERNNCNTETGEQVAEHHSVGEDGALAECLALGPGVPVQRKGVLRHVERTKDSWSLVSE